MRLLPRLIDKAHELGWDVRGGDLFRDPRTNGKMGEKIGYSNANSCHKLKLAIDLLLFREGNYYTQTEDYQQLGEWWEEQHPLTCWGGRFSDGNHFSITHEGSK